MRYLELAVTAPALAAEAVGAQFLDLGYAGVVLAEVDAKRPPPEVLTTRGYLPLLGPDAAADEAAIAVARSAMAGRLEALAAAWPELGSTRVTTAVVEEEDWAHGWKAYWHPQRIGEHLVVRPSWEAHEARPGDVVLVLDPKQAFGTGTHATTRLCLAELERLADRYRAGRVVDVGTGSGILAVAAALLGAADVEAVDTDPVAVEATRENVALNGVADRCHAAVGSADAVREPGDVVVANILAEVIVALAPELARLTRPGGTLVASGIIAEREVMVAEALGAVGFALEPARHEGEWVALTGRRG